MHWTNPWFLLGLMALAVPVIVHLFNLRRFHRVVFSNVRLLQHIVAQKARQKNLLHRLVLSLRLIALLLLVLAFAQPSFLQKEAPRGNQTAVCIYLDNSYSMSEVSQNTSLFELARQAARDIVRNYPAGTRFCLLTNDPFRPLFFSNAESCKRWIDETTLFPASLNLNQIQKRFQQLLNQQPGTQKQAYLVSDFRKNMAEGQIRKVQGFQTNWIAIPASEQPNISIDTAWLEAPVLPGEAQIRLRCQVSNHSSQNLEDLTVQLRQGDAVLSSKVLNIPAGASISADMQAGGFKKSASIPLSLQLADEGFPFDNKLFLSVWPVLVGKTTLQGNANRWLQTMLQSAPVFRDTGLQTGLFISCGQRNFGSTEAARMLELSNAGTCCVLIPDEASNADDLNKGLRELGFPEFSKLQSGTMLTGTPAYAHPMLREVFVKNPAEANLGSCSLFFPTGGSLAYAEALLLFRDGNPAVLYRKTSKGCIMVFTMPWVEENRAFLNSAIPLTLLINGALRRAHPQPLYLSSGNGQYLELNGALKEGKNWNLEFKGKKSIAEVVPFESFIRFYGGASMNEAGTYRLFNPEGTEAGFIAINAPRAESNPGLISETELEAMARAAGATLRPGGRLLPGGQHNNKRIRWLAAAGALFLMAEMILLAQRKKPAHVQPPL